MTDKDTTKVEVAESVQAYLKLAEKAPTPVERDKFVKMAANLARSREAARRAKLSKYS
jgi:hypothetical protein